MKIYLSEHLSCTPEEVKKKVDLLMKHKDFRGLQRQNPLGIAFAGLIRHILQRFGSASLHYELEVNANDIFPGITFPGRSTTPAMDIYVSDGQGLPKAVVSVKWSVRHDRINDLINKRPVYKAAAQRQSRITLPYYVVTNEFDPARLTKLLQDTCFDAVVHVHKPAVTEICGLDGRLMNLKDLTDFVQMV